VFHNQRTIKRKAGEFYLPGYNAITEVSEEHVPTIFKDDE
jgi:hypothetical protein